jgi:serine/threonine-protein kinase HipA
MDLSQSVENEFFCMRLTKAVGLPVAKVEIETFGDQRALVVERFDRLWDGQRLLRLPQEDFCQALSTPPAAKYESHGGPGMIRILERLLGSDTASADRATFLKATVWFWLLGATDGHAKNFSIALQPGGGFALTSLYDILSTQPLIDAHQLRHNQFKLSMAVGDQRRYVIAQVAPRHFAQTAARAGIGRSVVETLFDELLAAVPDALASVLADLPEGFPKAVDRLDRRGRRASARDPGPARRLVRGYLEPRRAIANRGYLPRKRAERQREGRWGAGRDWAAAGYAPCCFEPSSTSWAATSMTAVAAPISPRPVIAGAIDPSRCWSRVIA